MLASWPCVGVDSCLLLPNNFGTNCAIITELCAKVILLWPVCHASNPWLSTSEAWNGLVITLQFYDRTCITEKMQKFLAAFIKLCKATVSLVMCLSGSPSTWNSKSAPTSQIFMKLGIWLFFENISIKFKFFLKKCDKNKGYYTKTYVYLWYLSQLFLEWEMFQTKLVDKIKTHILCSITFLRQSCRLSDNVEKHGWAGQATDDNKIRHVRFACWITKATEIDSQYYLTAGPLQRRLRERASMLRYTYSASLLFCSSLLSSRLELPWHLSDGGTGHFLVGVKRLKRGSDHQHPSVSGVEMRGIILSCAHRPLWREKYSSTWRNGMRGNCHEGPPDVINMRLMFMLNGSDTCVCFSVRWQ
jgi:hypothetical protein